jgi:hypothetical protein
VSKPLAGKRYFNARGASHAARGRRLATAGTEFKGMPLWARNAFVDGFFGLGVRRRPAWVEGGVDIAEKRE